MILNILKINKTYQEIKEFLSDSDLNYYSRISIAKDIMNNIKYERLIK